MLTNMGWVGVDLFFVISGFLVSGLLFKEQLRSGTADLFRFFVRRGLKIYPLFFVLIGLTAIVYLASGQPVHYRLFAQELLFLQNYLGGLYLHTWSLAIEEHFYLLLILCFFILRRKRLAYLPAVCILFMVAPLILRFLSCGQGTCNNHFFTHTRIDSLFAGVLLSYLWHYRNARLRLRPPHRTITLVICTVAVCLFAFVAPESYFTQTAGFTLLAISFAGILLCVLQNNTATGAFEPMRFIGFYSYAIYLVHIPVKHFFERLGLEETAGAINSLYFLCYLLTCVLTGVLFSEMIEQPVLRLRNRIFPSKA